MVDSDEAALHDLAVAHAASVKLRRWLGYAMCGLGFVVALCIGAAVSQKLYGALGVPVMPLIGLATLFGVVLAIVSKAWLEVRRQSQIFEEEVEAILGHPEDDGLLFDPRDAVADAEAAEDAAR